MNADCRVNLCGNDNLTVSVPFNGSNGNVTLPLLTFTSNHPKFGESFHLPFGNEMFGQSISLLFLMVVLVNVSGREGKDFDGLDAIVKTTNSKLRNRSYRTALIDLV